MNKVRKFIENHLRNKVDLKVGDTVRVHQRIKEGSKERIQVFEGLIIAKKHGNGINGTFTVRKVSSGVGVEKIFPIHSPVIDKIEIVKSGRVRRAKIYYIRDATGRRGRLKEVKRKQKDEEVVEETIEKITEETSEKFTSTSAKATADKEVKKETDEVIGETKKDADMKESKTEEKMEEEKK